MPLTVVYTSRRGTVKHSALSNSPPFASTQCLPPCPSITCQVSTGLALHVTSWSTEAILYQHKLQHSYKGNLIYDREWYRCHILYQKVTRHTTYLSFIPYNESVLAILWKRIFDIRVLIRLFNFYRRGVLAYSLEDSYYYYYYFLSQSWDWQGISQY